VYLKEEKDALKNENDSYFKTKFECYKVKYFETEKVTNKTTGLFDKND
jgi:hypothetical protein